MGHNENGSLRRAGVRRAVITVVGALAVVGVLFALATEGPQRTRATARLGVAALAMVCLVIYWLFASHREKIRRTVEAAEQVGREAPAAAADPAPKAVPAPHPQEHPQGGAADLSGMLAHADDALLALRDLMSHGDAQSTGALSQLLGHTELLSWEPPAPMGASKLRRNGRWWLTLQTDGPLSEQDCDRLVTLEAALNVNDDLSSRSWPEKMTPEWRVASIFAGVADLQPHEGAPSVADALAGDSDPNGEWAFRLRLADALENLPAPFRVEADFRANLAEGVAGISAVVPRPGCLSICSGSRGVAWARGYALRLALLLARRAFAASRAVRRVVVCCHEHGDDRTLLSLNLSKGDLGRLLAAARGTALEDRGLPDDPALTFSLDGSGWFLETNPALSLDDGLLCPPERARLVELDRTPTTAAILGSCGARQTCELGIMEKAPRVGAWNEVAGELGQTTQSAVARLMALREETRDLTVAEACSRVSAALVEGTADVSDRKALASLFVDGGPLAATVREVRRLLDGKPTPEQLEQALDSLDAALSPIEQTGLYLDDGDCAYRYFNSLPERVTYNLQARRHADGRRVVLVPDEYYIAHVCAARILGALGRREEALAHAEELVRIAPATPDAALNKVRCLEEQSRIFEAADLLKETIRNPSTARDMAICFYRLAFMEWKLGRGDLSVACYQRAMELHADIAPQAARELSDLIETDGSGLSRLDDAEVIPALEASGIPAGPVDALRLMLRDATAACVDAGIFSVARALMGALLELTRDDALLDVYRSLQTQPTPRG